MADVTAHDFQLRAITTGFMNSFDFAFVTWWPIVFFAADHAPDYHGGYVASLLTGMATIPLIIVIAYLEKKGRKKGIIGRTKGATLSDDDGEEEGEEEQEEEDNSEENASSVTQPLLKGGAEQGHSYT